jgi:hypothetical protein
MAILSVTFVFHAFRYDASPITDGEFLAPMAIAPVEVEAAWSWQEPGGGAGVRIVTARRAQPVEDEAFDRWAAEPCASVVRFLSGRPAGAYDRLRSAGLLNLHLCADVVYVGDFPIVDWRPEMYAACRELDIGFGSMWELPEEHGPAEPAAPPDRGGNG